MKKFIEEAVERLVDEVRTDCGAESLAHVLAVVPTAESGRRLRLALARRFPKGIVPPEVRLPDQLEIDSEDPSLATRADELMALCAAIGGNRADVEYAAELADLRRLLAEKALSFADVAAVESGDERWHDLAELEKRYYDALAARSLKDRIQMRKEGRPLPEGVEKVMRFDHAF